MNTPFLPAQNLDAEESVISAVLISNAEYDYCSDLLATDFYKISHQIIWQNIINLFNKREPVDLVILATALKDSGKLKEVGGATYLAEIADSAPMVLNTSSYVKEIKSCSLNRKIYEISSDIMGKAMSGLPGEDLLSYSQSEIMKIQSSSKRDNIKRVSDIIDDHIERIENTNRTKETDGYLTGFPNIDNHLSVKGAKLIVVAGRPGMGKTSFSVSIMKNMDMQGICTGILSLEMPESEVMDKWIAMHSNLDSMKFRRFNGLKDNEYDKLTNGGRELSQSKIMIDDGGSVSINDVERKCRKMKKEGAQVIFIDQLSHINGEKDRFARYESNCNRIAQLKKELGIPIFLLAQLNRELEKRNSKEPQLSDLKMTGALEEDADAVLFIHRPEKYMTASELETSNMKGDAVINLAKNRAGGTYRDINIRFNEQTSYFYQGNKYQVYDN